MILHKGVEPPCAICPIYINYGSEEEYLVSTEVCPLRKCAICRKAATVHRNKGGGGGQGVAPHWALCMCIHSRPVHEEYGRGSDV